MRILGDRVRGERKEFTSRSLSRVIPQTRDYVWGAMAEEGRTARKRRGNVNEITKKVFFDIE